MQEKEKTINDLKLMFGEERVVLDRQALLQPEGVLVRHFEKAFGYVPEYLPVCILKLFSTQEVSKAVQYCNENGVSVIVQTGATSSEDQLVLVNDHTVVFDCSGMNTLYSLDEENMMATCGCGVYLAKLEELANAKGLTTGHCPQSQPVACMGGLVATRSIGQFSTYYGGIEDMLCGLEAVLPDGKIIRIRAVPRSAAGPDLRHFFMGTEGTCAIITEVTVKLFAYYPNDFWKGAYTVSSFEKGLDTIREILVKGYRPSVVRLYDKPDMDRNYGSVELKDGGACMFFIAEGPPELAKASGEKIHEIAKKHGASYIGTKVVDHWLQTRNDVCKTLGHEVVREQYRQTRVFYTTCEISASWTDIKKIYQNVMANIPQKIENLAMLGGHVSHSYQNGTNIYFVYEIKADDPLKMTDDDRKVKDAICTEVLKEPTGGIVHHHGVGKFRVNRIKDELGSSYLLLKGLKDKMDPKGIMNPGCLLPLE
jgi:FAD/FMN-containing dehydrogenase